MLPPQKKNTPMFVSLSVCWYVVFTPGPGPAVYQDRRLTYRGMSYPPAYTMRCLCPPKLPFLTPAPPTYPYEDYPPYLETRAPIYTAAGRTRYPLVTTSPPGGVRSIVMSVSVCLSVSLSVCLSVRSHNSKPRDRTHQIFTQEACGRGSVIL